LAVVIIRLEGAVIKALVDLLMATAASKKNVTIV